MVVCAASNSCGVLNTTVGGTSTTALSLSNASLPNGIMGTAYSYQLSAIGGSGVYTYSIVSGSLPAGLSLSAGGLLSGIPSASGTSSLIIAVTDSSNNTASSNFSIDINVFGYA